MNPSKTFLRKHFRSLRRSLPESEQRTAGNQLILRFGRHSWFRSAKNIAFYWPSDGEINPIPLLKIALKKGKNCFLPRVGKKNSMLFHQYKIGAPLAKDRFGIPQPLAATPSRDLSRMDLVFLPLVAFDRNGNRLGMGAGFYDRALKHAYRTPKRIGLSHSCQEAPQLPADPWDISLHAIATEKNILTL